jgi:glutathione S-transferase
MSIRILMEPINRPSLTLVITATTSAHQDAPCPFLAHGVLIYLDAALNADSAKRQQWMTRWMPLDFESLERRLAADDKTGEFSPGDTPGLADICFVPQVTNAERFDIDVTRYPAIERIVAR